jgi:hypothetical protein
MFDVEILYLARLLGYRVREVGVRWQDDGDSRSNLAVGTWKHARDLLKIRFTNYSRRVAMASEPALEPVLSAQGAAAAAASPNGRAC